MKYKYNTDQVIEALYDNTDPVSVDGADHMQELAAHIKELQSRLESLENEVKFSDMIRDDDLRREAVTSAMNEGFKSQDELLSKLSMEKDSARYRWLREDCGIVEYQEAFGSIGAGMLPCGDELDDAIDTAMQANKEG